MNKKQIKSLCEIIYNKMNEQAWIVDAQCYAGCKYLAHPRNLAKSNFSVSIEPGLIYATGAILKDGVRIKMPVSWATRIMRKMERIEGARYKAKEKRDSEIKDNTIKLIVEDLAKLE